MNRHFPYGLSQEHFQAPNVGEFSITLSQSRICNDSADIIRRTTLQGRIDVKMIDADAAVNGSADIIRHTTLQGRIDVKMIDTDAAVNGSADIIRHTTLQGRIDVKILLIPKTSFLSKTLVD